MRDLSGDMSSNTNTIVQQLKLIIISYSWPAPSTSQNKSCPPPFSSGWKAGQDADLSGSLLSSGSMVMGKFEYCAGPPYRGRPPRPSQRSLSSRFVPLAENVERLYCKRPAILCLASSKIFTPHPPLRPASVYPPPLLRGEDTLAGWRGG